MLLLERRGVDPLKPMEMVERGILILDFDVGIEAVGLLESPRSYADIPMSLADACLVRMSELSPRSRVITTDSDFLRYPRNPPAPNPPDAGNFALLRSFAFS